MGLRERSNVRARLTSHGRDRSATQGPCQYTVLILDSSTQTTVAGGPPLSPAGLRLLPYLQTSHVPADRGAALRVPQHRQVRSRLDLSERGQAPTPAEGRGWSGSRRACLGRSELVDAGDLASRKDVPSGGADRFQGVDWRAFGAVAGAQDLDNPLVRRKLEGLALEQGWPAGGQAVRGPDRARGGVMPARRLQIGEHGSVTYTEAAGGRVTASTTTGMVRVGGVGSRRRPTARRRRIVRWLSVWGTGVHRQDDVARPIGGVVRAV